MEEKPSVFSPAHSVPQDVMEMLPTSSTADSRCILIPSAQQETPDTPEKSSFTPQTQSLNLPLFQVNMLQPNLTATPSREELVSYQVMPYQHLGPLRGQVK